MSKSKEPCRNCGSTKYYAINVRYGENGPIDHCSDCGLVPQKSNLKSYFVGKKNREYRDQHPEDFAQPFHNDGSVNEKFTKLYGNRELKPSPVVK